MLDISIDSRLCEKEGEHKLSTRHMRKDCPVEQNKLPSIPAVKPVIHPRPLTAREVKNKILAGLTESERDDSVVGETRQGGYLIATHNKVIEVYASGTEIYAQVFQNQFDGWEDYNYE
jgi:hypothetical protein